MTRMHGGASIAGRSLSFLFESNEKNFVYWFERRNQGRVLTATPIDVSQHLCGEKRLFEQFDTSLLTSDNTDGGRALRLHPAAARH